MPSPHGFPMSASAQIHESGMAATELKRPGRDDPLGFQSALAHQLQAQGDIALDDLEARYSDERRGVHYLDGVTFDIRKAKYWDLLYPDIDENRKKLAGDRSSAWQHTRGRKAPSRFVPTSLSQVAQGKLAKNGFVVVDSNFRSFGDAFHKIYSDDLPVFVGADALLHAWHRTYEEMLVDMEQWCLAPKLKAILEGMHGKVQDVASELGSSVIVGGLKDADHFLTVALSLLLRKEAGTADTTPGTTGDEDESEDEVVLGSASTSPDASGKVSSALGDDEAVDKTLGAIRAEQMSMVGLFGSERRYDCSQFKPRGHYERNDVLRNYFRAVTWCGRTDMRVGAAGEGHTRELRCALALLCLLKKSGEFQEWERLDATLQNFIGETDSMTFTQLDTVFRQYCSQVSPPLAVFCASSSCCNH